jgi:hypothetical protein
VVPQEIRDTYKKLVETDFLEDKCFHNLLNNYAVAAISLYGVIEQDDFVTLFNSQNERQTNIDAMFPILLNNIYTDSGYCFWDKYIVDEDFEENDFEEVLQLVAERKNKPRYSPSKEDFLKYSDWDYYETTPCLFLPIWYINPVTSGHRSRNMRTGFLRKRTKDDIYAAKYITIP